MIHILRKATRMQTIWWLAQTIAANKHKLFSCCAILHMFYCLSIYFKYYVPKTPIAILSACQTVYIKIRPDNLSFGPKLIEHVIADLDRKCLRHVTAMESVNILLWLFLCSNQYWAGRVYGLCVYFMSWAPECSTDSGSGEGGKEA